MLTQIKNWLTGAVIFECDCELESEAERIGFAVKAAVKAGVSLDRARLVGARLDRARLDGASLVGARLDGASLVGASLDGARLDRASLVGARLDRASLVGARLDGASLDRASLVGATGITDEFPLPEGITLGEFKREIVPQLLTAGGKTVEQVVASGAWDCHDWTNCPMHVALGVSDFDAAPPLLRPWVKRFVQLFDSKLIPCPEVSATAE